MNLIKALDFYFFVLVDEKRGSCVVNRRNVSAGKFDRSLPRQISANLADSANLSMQFLNVNCDDLMKLNEGIKKENRCRELHYILENGRETFKP